MILGPHAIMPAILSQIVQEAAAASEPTRTQHVLSTVDQALSAGALVLVVCTGVWWTARSGPDPLRSAPARPNQLREDAVALAVLVYLLAMVLISGLVELATGQTEDVLATAVTGNGAHLAGIGICLFIAARSFDGGIRRFWFAEGGPRRRPWITITLALTVLATGLCPLVRDATMGIILYFAPGYEFDPHPTIEALHDQTQPVGLIIGLWAGAVLVAPMAEEVFFRGLLQTLLVRLARSRWLSIALVSLAFGAVHFQQPHAMAALAVLAVLIGYAYERTGSLVPPIVIHAAFNLKTLIWDALGAFPT